MTNIEKTDKRGNRSIDTVYSFPDAAIETEHDETVTPQLSIYSYHDKDGKRFVSRIDRQTHAGMFVRQVITYGNDDFPPVINRRVFVPVTRFNQKNLEAFHLDVLAKVESLHSDDLEALHAWAKAAVETHGH